MNGIAIVDWRIGGYNSACRAQVMTVACPHHDTVAILFDLDDWCLSVEPAPAADYGFSQTCKVFERMERCLVGIHDHWRVFLACERYAFLMHDRHANPPGRRELFLEFIGRC